MEYNYILLDGKIFFFVFLRIGMRDGARETPVRQPRQYESLFNVVHARCKIKHLLLDARGRNTYFQRGIIVIHREGQHKILISLNEKIRGYAGWDRRQIRDNRGAKLGENWIFKMIQDRFVDDFGLSSRHDR